MALVRGLGTLGGGPYATIRQGDGTGPGTYAGSGGGEPHSRPPRVPRPPPLGLVRSTGELDAEIIRKYIRQRTQQFQYCYEKQLSLDPALSGTVSTDFKIAPDGQVIAAQAAGMGSREVEACVVEVIRAIRFPKPTGGGFVTVGYPFTFRSTN